MAVPHYAYPVLKMPSPAGVLALWANLSIAYAYETESLALAKVTDLSIQMASVVTDAKMVPVDGLEIPLLEPPRTSTKSKEIMEVGLGLDSPSYVPMLTCLLGNLQTCRGYHGRRSSTP